MLDSMGHARHIFLVTEGSNINVHGGACLVRLRVVYEQHLELIWQADHTVCTVV
jgi:hypothetical protein